MPLLGTEVRLQRAIDREKVRCEEVTIIMALKAHLNREVTMDDARRCSQKISEPWDGSYRLFYTGENGIKEELGIVKYIESPTNFRVEFVPIVKMN